MKTKKMVNGFFAILVLSLTVYGGLIKYNNSIMVEDELIETSGNGFGQSMGVMLIIENERNGEIIYRMEKEDDLILRNMAGCFHGMLKGQDVETSTIYKMSNGASYTLSFSYGFNSDRSRIRIGTGTTAPTYEDWKLETEIYGDKVEAIGYSVSSLEMNATSITTFNILDTYAITEAGLSFYYHTIDDFLMYRDVFDAIKVVSGDLLTVKYILMFN